MNKAELLKMIAALKAKIQEAFTKMLESSSDEDIKKYENLQKQLKDVQAQLAEAEALEEKEDLDNGGKPAPVDPMNEGNAKNKPKLTETQKFGKELVEAVSKGTTFTGVLPREVSQAIVKKKEEICRVRGLCTVHQATGEYTVYIEGDGATVTYVTEAGTIGETSPSLKPLALSALKLGALVKVSREFLDDLGVDVMNYLTEQIAKGFAKKEDHEILFGAGTASSKTSMRGITSNTSIGTVTAAAQTTVTWEEVKQTIQKIGAYRNGATIVCSQAFLDICHSFKDGSTYMFPQGSQITSIMGIPVRVSGEFEALAAGKVVMIVGDFSYYHILDRMGMEIVTLNELYAATDQVGIRALERIDGDIALPKAFACLKTKASA